MTQQRAAIICRGRDYKTIQEQIENMKRFAQWKGCQIDNEDIYASLRKGPVKNNTELKRLVKEITRGGKQFHMVFVETLTLISNNPTEIRELMQVLNEAKIPLFVTSMGEASLAPDGEPNQQIREALYYMLFNMDVEIIGHKARTAVGVVRGKRRREGDDYLKQIFSSND